MSSYNLLSCKVKELMADWNNILSGFAKLKIAHIAGVTVLHIHFKSFNIHLSGLKLAGSTPFATPPYYLLTRLVWLMMQI